ncbi:hypothetical protein M1615_04205 [Patescibacteria group bacterium]|nr:hypothetical protein [Patescibacteria group bacterium]MCL5010292.1 hypothetical protein [Patescibacteria group bacterium]
MNREKVGILLTDGQSDGITYGSHLRPPNLEGRFRCLAASTALRRSDLDRVIVTGGMTDKDGVPLEDGYARYMRDLLLRDKPNLAERVEVLPRDRETCDTIEDIREALRGLRQTDADPSVTFISSRHHLYPRTAIITLLLGVSDAHFQSAESIFNQEFQGKKDTKRILQRVYPLPHQVKGWAINLAIATVLLVDFLPGNLHLGSRLVTWEAKRQRL